MISYPISERESRGWKKRVLNFRWPLYNLSKSTLNYLKIIVPLSIFKSKISSPFDVKRNFCAWSNTTLKSSSCEFAQYIFVEETSLKVILPFTAEYFPPIELQSDPATNVPFAKNFMPNNCSLGVTTLPLS